MAKGFHKEFDLTDVDLEDIECIVGGLDAHALSWGIVVSRFNEVFTKQLLDSAIQALLEKGASRKTITVVWVPGAYEIPLVVQQLAQQKRFSALIALGAVIQGETPHAELINTTVVQALSAISRRFCIPVIDGIVTAHTEEQARVRCAKGRASRGWYAALAAVEMARVLSHFQD